MFFIYIYIWFRHYSVAKTFTHCEGWTYFQNTQWELHPSLFRGFSVYWFICLQESIVRCSNAWLNWFPEPCACLTDVLIYTALSGYFTYSLLPAFWQKSCSILQNNLEATITVYRTRAARIVIQPVMLHPWISPIVFRRLGPSQQSDLKFQPVA